MIYNLLCFWLYRFNSLSFCFAAVCCVESSLSNSSCINLNVRLARDVYTPLQPLNQSLKQPISHPTYVSTNIAFNYLPTNAAVCNIRRRTVWLSVWYPAVRRTYRHTELYVSVMVAKNDTNDFNNCPPPHRVGTLCRSIAITERGQDNACKIDFKLWLVDVACPSRGRRKHAQLLAVACGLLGNDRFKSLPFLSEQYSAN